MNVHSSFFTHYKELEKNLDKTIPTKEVSKKLLQVIKKNLQILSKLSEVDLNKMSLNFDKNGEIVFDDWRGKKIRALVNKHIFQYSSYSTNVRHDLYKFTEFVNKYLNIHMQNIEVQDGYVLEKMIQQSIKGLRKFEKNLSKDDLKSLNIVKSRTKLENSLKTLKEGLTLKQIQSRAASKPHLSIFSLDLLKNNILLIKENEELQKIDQVQVLKNQLNEVQKPSVLFTPGVQEMYQREKMKIEMAEKEVQEINEQISAHMQAMKDGETDDEKFEELINKKKEIQLSEDYCKSLDYVTAYDNLLMEYEEYYDSVFGKDAQYQQCKEFVDHLGLIYPNADDRTSLLSHLLLFTPTEDKLKKIEGKLRELTQNKLLMSTERIQLQRKVLRKSGLFDEAISLINLRKKKKIEAFEQEEFPEAMQWKMGRAAANFIAVGGLTAISFVLPHSVGQALLGYIPGYVHAGMGEIEGIWSGTSPKVKHEITTDLKNLIKQIKEDPLHAHEKVADLFDKNAMKAQEMRDLVAAIASIVQKNPDSFDEIDDEDS